MTKSSILAAMRLALVSGVGPTLYRALVDHFGSPDKVFTASPSDLRAVPGVGPKILAALLKQDEAAAHEEFELCEREQIAVHGIGTATYPRPLARIDDPPPILFSRGEWLEADELSLAIVGTRHASNYGLRIAERLSAAVARAGFTIVSGLARGIDTMAHRAALQAGGRTVAVLGSGLLQMYPPENEKLAVEISGRGALLSEQFPRSPPLGYAFPQRNRIITGLCLGTLVVEAGETSGALISARLAMEQGKEVFAVPGPIDSPESKGCHALLRDGATLVQSADDILEQLGPLAAPVKTDDAPTPTRHPAELTLSDLERQVLDVVPVEVGNVDQVIVASNLPTPRVLAILSVLEMKKLIRRVSGTLVARI